MMTFNQFQREQKEWAARNFKGHVAWHALLGLVEEVGELSHAHLKTVQGIRDTPHVHYNAKIDAVGDILIYLADYCTMSGINLDQAVTSTWAKVKKRDWAKYPHTGMKKESRCFALDGFNEASERIHRT